MDWTVLMLHAFWDSWIHERDVLLARGTEHPTDGDATAYATAYGLFIAAAVASMFGDRVQEKLTLGGDGGGVFELDSRGAVTFTVNRVTTTGPPAAEVADALAGRAPVAAVLGDCRPARVPPCAHRRLLQHASRAEPGLKAPAKWRPNRPGRPASSAQVAGTRGTIYGSGDPDAVSDASCRT